MADTDKISVARVTALRKVLLTDITSPTTQVLRRGVSMLGLCTAMIDRKQKLCSGYWHIHKEMLTPFRVLCM